MQHRTVDFSLQLDSLADKINAVPNPLARRDLVRMLRHARDLYDSLDKELVVCRNFGRYTNRYTSIESQLVEQIRQVSKWLTLALLKY